MKPIYTTRGERSKPLDIHYWNDEDGWDMKQFRQSLSTQTKKDFSEDQGEIFGHRYVTDRLKYQEVFHADNKSIHQGLDSIYRDNKTGELVVVEFKGQKSSESNLQKKPSWTPDTCEKIQRRDSPYNQVSEYERGMAKKVLDAYEKGERIRYEVVRTEVDEKTGKFKTQLEKQTYLEKPLVRESKGELKDGKAVIDKLYEGSTKKEKSKDSKTESKRESKSESKKG